MARVGLEKINKLYGAVPAVIDVDLLIEDNEFVVLVGPSGCGKSTTLRMVAGLEEVSSGIIRIGDRTVNHLAPKDRDIAMVFQNYALYLHMTVYDNLAFGLRNRRVAEATIRREVMRAAEILDIGGLLDRKPRQLSGGQQQRVALGRCIVRHPQVFLFDEPLSNLDAKLRAQMRIELKRLRERVTTTSIYVTHDQVEAMTLADRIVVMNKGCIEQVGKPLELYYAPANLFVAGFIGSPAMNFFEAKVERIEGGCARVAGAGFRSFDLPTTSLKVGDRLTVGVRPEHLAQRTDGLFAVEGVVELVERLGESSFAYLRRADGRLFVAEVRGRQTPTPGERTTLTATTQDVHVFDASGFRVSMQNNS